MTTYCYITFPTIFSAIRAESLLRNEQHAIKMVPVPRVISSSCGTALRSSCDEVEAIRNHLLAQGVELEKTYRIWESGLNEPELKELFNNA